MSDKPRTMPLMPCPQPGATWSHCLDLSSATADLADAREAIAAKDAEIARLNEDIATANECHDYQKSRTERAEAELAAKDAEIERRTGDRDRWQANAVRAGEIANDLQNKWLSDKARAERAESRLLEVESERDGLREMVGKAKSEVSRILRETLSGLNTRYSHPSGAGRWGLVEADIHAVIDALASRHATNAADAPEVKP